jgi:hypothetical protein
MSTGLIIAIVIVAIIIIALLVMLPRMRATARQKQAQRELHSRRETVAGEHRAEAAEREQRAEMAEQKARMAQQAADRERAEANLREEKASMHERGLADDELIEEDERDRFADVAGPDRTADAERPAGERPATERPAGESPDEGRFGRERITDDVRESDRPRQ